MISHNLFKKKSFVNVVCCFLNFQTLHAVKLWNDCIEYLFTFVSAFTVSNE